MSWHAFLWEKDILLISPFLAGELTDVDGVHVNTTGHDPLWRTERSKENDATRKNGNDMSEQLYNFMASFDKKAVIHFNEL